MSELPERVRGLVEVDPVVMVELAAATDQRFIGSIRKQLVTAEKKASKPASQQSDVPDWARRER